MPEIAILNILRNGLQKTSALPRILQPGQFRVARQGLHGAQVRQRGLHLVDPRSRRKVNVVVKLKTPTKLTFKQLIIEGG